MDERSVEQRLGDLERVEAIKALKYRYWRACDGKDPGAFRACFVSWGASIDFGVLGRFDDADRITEVFTDIALREVNGRPVIYDMHHGFHPHIELHSESEATGVWTLAFRQVNLLNGTETVSSGEYDDAYRFEDGGWRMSRCHYTVRWSITRPLASDTVVMQ
ncbi:nuclear transport factor 2 family protein [Rhodococcus tibetensis]|uniref:Nuclear transport factor 2 family protein n=1 Tax=Rhodococcus tibetensis TaxID=2965064 RepID=A0ABT1QAR9_9NOCA|nr:nuclear transport factor 2 family protein [Rhodococcus sp. FXJ9.536]MCQ4119376.1 nuclear transport factor 2 family protein [Rhodococcus sp. FXJ9.536]